MISGQLVQKRLHWGGGCWAWPWGMLLLFSCSVVANFFGTPWIVTNLTPLSMGFPRQEYWSELPFPSPGDLPNPGIEHAFPALAGGFFTSWATREAPWGMTASLITRATIYGRNWKFFFSCKGPDSKYFRLCRLHNCAFEWESSHRQYVNECSWLCSNKTLFMDTEI